MHQTPVRARVYISDIGVGAAGNTYSELESEQEPVYFLGAGAGVALSCYSPTFLMVMFPDALMIGENASTVDRRRHLLRRITAECEVDIADGGPLPATVWNEYNSFFFCFTVVTTIGERLVYPGLRIPQPVSVCSVTSLCHLWNNLCGPRSCEHTTHWKYFFTTYSPITYHLTRAQLGWVGV